MLSDSLAVLVRSDDEVDMNLGVDWNAKVSGQLRPVGFRPNPIIETLKDHHFVGAELGLDQVEATSPIDANEVDV
jgi:hypothetical protein